MKFRFLFPLIFCSISAFVSFEAVPLLAAPQYRAIKAHSVRERDGLPSVFQKLKQGKELRIAYFGGSITAANGWRPLTTRWFSKQFPQNKIHEINAAIGGTGSDLGAFRLKRDVLDHKPDLVFIEFAVNDGGRKPEDIWESMEGIVRQIWLNNPETEICFVYTFRVGYEKDLRKGVCPRAASAMEMLADHYGIPSINVALKIVELESAGKLIFKADTPAANEKVIRFSKDGVHPLTRGHEIYTEVISDAILSFQNSKKKGDHSEKMKQPFVAGNWEDAKMIPLEAKMLSGNWKALSSSDILSRKFSKRMGTIWVADQAGSKISFKFKGSQVAIYDLLGPDAGQVVITVDGVKQKKIIPRFDRYCTYHRIATLTVANKLDPTKTHTITVEIHPDQPDRKSISFRLKDPVTELKSPKYQGRKIRASQIMIRGELVN